MQLDCSNCPWKTDREACRMCRKNHQDHGEDAGAFLDRPDVDRFINHDVPGARERANEFAMVHDLANKLKDGLVSGALTPASNDAVLTGFLCVAGQEHAHYIHGHVDVVEYTDPQYGVQN